MLFLMYQISYENSIILTQTSFLQNIKKRKTYIASKRTPNKNNRIIIKGDEKLLWTRVNSIFPSEMICWVSVREFSRFHIAKFSLVCALKYQKITIQKIHNLLGVLFRNCYLFTSEFFGVPINMHKVFVKVENSWIFIILLCSQTLLLPSLADSNFIYFLQCKSKLET